MKHRRNSGEQRGRIRFPSRHEGWVLQVGLGLLLLAICAQPLTAQDKPLHDITLQLKWTHQFQFAGYYAALEQGFYEAEGLNVALLPGGPGLRVVDQVASGKADFGLLGSELVLERMKGKPFVLVAVIFQHSPHTIIVRKDSNITTPADLVGKPMVLNLPGSAEHMAMFAREGIARERLLISQQDKTAMSKLIAGDIVAMSGYTTNQPFLFRQKGIAVRMIQPVDYGVDFYGDSVFTTEQFLKDHPEHVAAFRRATLRGWEYAHNHASEITDLILKKYAPNKIRAHLEFEAKATCALIASELVEVGHVNPGRIRRIAKTYAEMGMAKKDFSLNGFLYEPRNEANNSWVWQVVKFALAGLLLACGVVGLLLLFNRRLRKAIEARTAELSDTSRQLEKETHVGKETHKALLDSEERFRLIAENAQQWIWEVDAAGLYTYSSPISKDVLGMSPEEIVGKKHFYDFFHPDEREELMTAALGVMAKGLPFREFQNRNLNADGEEVWLSTSGSPILGRRGKVLGYRGSDTDITELRRDRLTLQHRIEMERNLGEMSASFLNISTGDLGRKMNQALESMGSFMEVDRSYIFIISDDDTMSNTSEWCAPDIEPHKDELQNIPVDALPWWMETLKNEGRIYIPRVSQMPPEARATQERLEAQDIQSLVAVPLYAGDLLTGFVGFDSVAAERSWSDADIALLRTMGGTIANAMSRYHAESALRASEEKYRHLVEQSNSIILRTDVKGNITFVNEFAQRFFGYSEEELLGRNAVGTIVPETESSGRDLAAMINDLCQHPDRYETNENENLCRDGRRVWVAWANKLISDEADAKGEILCIGNDVTDRKKADEALRESDARLRGVFRIAPTGIGVVIDRVLKEVNDRVCEMTGYAWNELKGQDARMLYATQEDYDYVGREKYHQIQNHGTGTVETHWRRKDGQMIDVLLSSTPLDLDDLTKGVTFTALDITERRQAAEALRSSEERLRDLAELLPEAVFETDRNSKLTFANQRAFDLFGYSDEDFARGLNGFDMIAPEDRELAKANLLARMGSGNLGTLEYLAIKKDGTIFPILFHASAIMKDDEFIGLRGIIIDITDRKKVEEQLRQSEKMQAIGQLAGGIAHDFNNQLAGVLGYADLLASRLEDPQLRNFAERIKISATRSADLTKQLLAFSRKGKNLSIPVDINEVLAEVVSILKHSIDKRISIRQILNATTSTTDGDPTQLQNALLNLALNGRDAMPKGGDLIFETSVATLDDDFRQRHPYELPPGPYLKISVTDTGVGMSSETQRHIFEPFFTTKEQGKGTGMGLASVYGTIRNHQGAITVYSEPGHGTTFSAYLPLSEAENLPDEPVQRAPAKGTAHIVIVDDEEIVCQVGATMLRELGYKVTTCKDGEEAVELYRKSWKQIDLVILDMIMPRMNGREAFLAMREINPHIRAILSSGYSMNEEAQNILDEGVMAFIGKPFSISRFSEVVSQALQGDA
jgi:PAS domain S-box-containing protein